MNAIKKILVPTDFSDYSLAGVEFVNSLIELYDAEVFIMHIIDDTPVLAFHTVDLNSETVLRDAERKAKKDLNEFVHEKIQHPGKFTQIIRRGDAQKEIVKFAEEEDIDLIVMATHGRTGLAHVLMGSVAEKVVRHSTVPVLTVKPRRIREKMVERQDVEEQLHFRA